MREAIISFETAKLAKEKGFYFVGSEHSYADGRYFIPAPPQSVLQKWLREKHGIHIAIDGGQLSDKWMYDMYSIWTGTNYGITDMEFSSYEEALEHGLMEALKII